MDHTLRMTHQREIILHELKKSNMHPTADELYERIKKKLPRISLATVYRNLEILSEAGLINKLEISGRQKRFDWNPEQHNHIYCTRCQRVDNIPFSEASAPGTDSIPNQEYKITGWRIEFLGICPACQSKEQQTKKGVHQMGCKACENNSLSDSQRNVLEALAKTSDPCGSKELAEATGLEAKQVSCQITALKNKGYVASPVRCKYAITEQGKNALT